MYFTRLLSITLSAHCCAPYSRAALSFPPLRPRRPCKFLPCLLTPPHFCVQNNRAMPSPCLLSQLFHRHFHLSNSRIALTQPIWPPKQSRYFWLCLLTHSFSPTSAFKSTRRPFTLTSACQAIFLLTHGHFCLSESHIALSEPFRPPKTIGLLFATPWHPLFRSHFGLPNDPPLYRLSIALVSTQLNQVRFTLASQTIASIPPRLLSPPLNIHFGLQNIALLFAPPLSHHSFAATSASQTIRRYTTATSRKNTATFCWCHSYFSSITATSHSA